MKSKAKNKEHCENQNIDKLEMKMQKGYASNSKIKQFVGSEQHIKHINNSFILRNF